MILSGHRRRPGAMGYASNESLAYSWDRSGSLFLWHLAEATTPKILRSRAATRDVAFSPDGAGLIAVHCDGRVSRWDLAKFPPSAAATLLRLTPGRNFLAPCGGRVLVCHDDMTSSHVFDLTKSPPTSAALGQSCADFRAMTFSPDGTHFANTTKNDGGRVVWNLTGSAPERQVELKVSDLRAIASLQFSPGNTHVVGIPYDEPCFGGVRYAEPCVWDIRPEACGGVGRALKADRAQL